MIKNRDLEGFWAALGRFRVTVGLPDFPKTPSRRLWGCSWIDFWSIFACLGGVLGAPWAVLGRSWGVLGRLGGVLERLGGALGLIFLTNRS